MVDSLLNYKTISYNKRGQLAVEENHFLCYRRVDQDFKDCLCKTLATESLEDAIRAPPRAEIELSSVLVNVDFKAIYVDIFRLQEAGEVLDLELAMFEGTGIKTWASCRES